MPRVEVPRTWCDVCWATGQRVEGKQVTLAVSDRNGEKSGSMLLCKAHRDELVGPLLRHLRLMRRKPAEPKSRQRGRDAGPFLCQVPGCHWPPLKHRGTLTQHLKTIHGGDPTIEEYRARYGLVPLTAQEAAAVVVTVSCPECGEVYSTSAGYRWPHQALRNHLLAAHLVKLTQRELLDRLSRV